MKHKITGITPGSVAEELGIKVGNYLISINDKELKDRFDYLYHMTKDTLLLLIEDEEGEVEYELYLDEGEDLGLEFETGLMDDAKSCKNNCVFCFIDQLPKGLRKSLYFKDDDSRLSFMQGNFLTLTNMSNEDLYRIAELGIHPINISVHTLNPDLRLKMLKNPRAKDINEQIKILHDLGVQMNAQIVLVPEYNDGDDLLETLRGLTAYYPEMNSVAIVPLGLTKHRENCINLNPVSKELARSVISRVEAFQQESLLKFGTRFAFLADEFYLKAEYSIPEAEHYEGYLHYEDGVGMIRKFTEEWKKATKEPATYRKETLTLATAQGFYPYLKALIEELNNKEETNVKVLDIQNEFLGNSVNVTGLLSFSDILEYREEIEGDLFLCESMFNTDGITLDEKSLEDFLSYFGKVKIIGADAYSLVDALKEGQ